MCVHASEGEHGGPASASASVCLWVGEGMDALVVVAVDLSHLMITKITGHQSILGLHLHLNTHNATIQIDYISLVQLY